MSETSSPRKPRKPKGRIQIGRASDYDHPSKPQAFYVASKEVIAGRRQGVTHAIVYGRELSQVVGKAVGDHLAALDAGPQAVEPAKPKKTRKASAGKGAAPTAPKNEPPKTEPPTAG